MTAIGLHASLFQLSQFLATAKFKMALRRLATPRRIILSIVAIVLGAIWIGQAVAGVLFRPAADPAKMMVWIPLGLMSYAIWNTIKTVCRTPIEPFEWTPTEREMLIGAPFGREQIVGFRLYSIVCAGVLKAICFSLVMLPDIRVWPAALIGMLLALVLIDLLRMLIEVIAYGMTDRQFLWLRGAVLALATGAGLSALISASCLPVSAHDSAWPAPFGFAISILDALIALHNTAPGWLLMRPFAMFGQLILCQATDWSCLISMAGCLLAVTLIGRLLFIVDAAMITRRRVRAQQVFDRLPRTTKTRPAGRADAMPTGQTKLRFAHRLGGIGTLFWLQYRGMVRYRTTLLLSLILPGFLSLLPLFTQTDNNQMLFQVVGSLAFYSFVLLPAALRFDFRRDVDRLVVMKALPFSPTAMTIGQLAAPVAACTLFQLVVLAIAWILRPYGIGLLLLAIAVLLPVNMLIFCVENLIFLLYPYRPNQEGIGVFLRSILTFTAKSVIFFLGLVGTILLVLTAGAIARQIPWGDYPTRVILIFSVGMWSVLVLNVLFFGWMLRRALVQFDCSQDTPAMS